MTDLEQRPRFYEGQYLEAADLSAAVDYSRSQLARAQLGAHTWGVALGLNLVEVPGPNDTLDVFVQPGYAWDGFGRPIVLAEPAKISPVLFSSFDVGFVVGSDVVPRTVDVWIRYVETMTKGPRPGFEGCDDTSAFARVQESYRIEVGAKTTVADQRDEIEIFGRSFDAAQALKEFDATAPVLEDASVPHQTLPEEDETKLWLVHLGVVSWQPGNPGKLVARDADQIAASEKSVRYSGVVAGSVEASSGYVRIHDRGKAYSTFFTDELMWVEGELRIDGHTRLYGGRLELVSSHAEDPVKPFYVLRADYRDELANKDKKKMQLVIGDAAAGDNILAIGPQTAADVYAEHMVVTDAGNVGIGTSAPVAPLHVKDDGLQIGISGTPEDNFHIKADASGGPRALRFYNKDFGAGAHLASLTQAGRLGVGITEPTNKVHVDGSLGVRQNSLYMSGGPGWSSISYNAHHNDANNAWVFPDNAKPAMTIEMDDASDLPRFEVYSTIVGDNEDWRSRFRVHGHSGNIGMAANGGNVGIGTYSPLAKLDVRGTLRVSGDLEIGGSQFKAVAAEDSVRMLWGTVMEDGSINSGSGFTVNRTGAGQYQINFGTAFADTPTVVVTKVYLSIGGLAGATAQPRENAIVDQITLTSTTIAIAVENGTLTDSNFCFIVVGTR